MKFEKLVAGTTRGIHAITRLLTWIAGVALGIMILLVVSNIFGRFLFRKPLLGTIELVELLLVVVVFFVVAYTEAKRGHVRVDLVVSRLPRRIKTILGIIVHFIGAAFFVAIGWQGGDLMWSHLFPSLRATDILAIPLAPFMFVIAFGSLLLALEMLISCFYGPSSEATEGEVK